MSHVLGEHSSGGAVGLEVGSRSDTGFSYAPTRCFYFCFFPKSTVLSSAFVRDLEGKAACFVSGRRKCFVQPGRRIFFFFFPLHWKNLEHCNLNFAKIHFGREVEEWRAGAKCDVSAAACSLCCPPRAAACPSPAALGLRAAFCPAGTALLLGFACLELHLPAPWPYGCAVLAAVSHHQLCPECCQ